MSVLARIFGGCANFALRHFFRKVQVTGAAPVEDGPLIVIGNHPYAIVDPLLIASAYERNFSFIAKSTLFEGRIKGALLRALDMIPINRVQDGGNQRDNLKILEDTARIVVAGRALIVFAEGASQAKRVVQPLKNGPARIALLAEQMASFGGNVRIQIAGITYSDFYNPFKSSVTINLQEPITVAEWKEKCEKHLGLAARDLTRRIESNLRAATAEIPDDDSRVAEMLAALYQGRSNNDDHTRFRLIGEQLGKLPGEAVPDRAKLVADLEEYTSLARKLRVTAGDERKSPGRRITTLLSAPLVYLGWALHYLPYRIARARADSIKCKLADRGYNRLKLGVRTFLGWYGCLALLLVTLTSFGLLGWLPALAVMLAYPALGALASNNLRACNASVLDLFGSRDFRRMQTLGRKLLERCEELRYMQPPAASEQTVEPPAQPIEDGA